MYGSNFWRPTLSPRETRRRPIDEAAMPFPSEETTPPVTKMNRVWPWGMLALSSVGVAGREPTYRRSRTAPEAVPASCGKSSPGPAPGGRSAAEEAAEAAAHRAAAGLLGGGGAALPGAVQTPLADGHLGRDVAVLHLDGSGGAACFEAGRI